MSLTSRLVVRTTHYSNVVIGTALQEAFPYVDDVTNTSKGSCCCLSVELRTYTHSHFTVRLCTHYFYIIYRTQFEV